MSSSPKSPGPLAPRLAPFPFEREHRRAGGDSSPASPASPASLSFDMDFSFADADADDVVSLPPSADISEASVPPPPASPSSPAASVRPGSVRRVRIAEPESLPDSECAYLEVEEDEDAEKEEETTKAAAAAAVPVEPEQGRKIAGSDLPGVVETSSRLERTCFVLPVIPTATASLVLAMIFKILMASTYAGLVTPLDDDVNDFKQGDVAAVLAVVIVNVLFAVCYLVGFMAVSKRLVMTVKAVMVMLGFDTLLTPAQYLVRVVSLNRAIAAELGDADDAEDFRHVARLRGKASASFVVMLASLVFNLVFMYALFRYVRTVSRKPAPAEKAVSEGAQAAAAAAGSPPEKSVAVCVA